MEEMLTTKEAADYLGLKPVTLNRWRHQFVPDKPHWIDYGTSIRYRKDDLDEWILEHRMGGARA